MIYENIKLYGKVIISGDALIYSMTYLLLKTMEEVVYLFRERSML